MACCEKEETDSVYEDEVETVGGRESDGGMANQPKKHLLLGKIDEGREKSGRDIGTD